MSEFYEPPRKKCSNGTECPYRDWGEASFAYSQHIASWEAGEPRYHGLCLNCLDDTGRYGESDE